MKNEIEFLQPNGEIAGIHQTWDLKDAKGFGFMCVFVKETCDGMESWIPMELEFGRRAYFIF